MKVSVSTNVQKVTFEFNPFKSSWAIYMNGRPLQEWHNSLSCIDVGYKTAYYDSLKDATKHAKSKGLIPKDFDEEWLQNEVEVIVDNS
jgi:hypothetical protein